MQTIEKQLKQLKLELIQTNLEHLSLLKNMLEFVEPFDYEFDCVMQEIKGVEYKLKQLGYYNM